MTFSIQAPIDQFELPHPSGTGCFQISVSRVAKAPEGAKVPVLFMLDADIGFALAAEIARLRGTVGGLPTAMVVGIGYGADYAEFAKLRTADLTPPLSEAGRAALGGMAGLIGEQDGGAEAFLGFLVETLKPEIARRYAEASATDHILCGHSLGGLFTAFALLTRPDAFATFLAGSPSLWWDGFAILTHLPAFAERLTKLERHPRVLVSVGGQEQDAPTKVPLGLGMSLADVQAMVAASRMVDAASEFAVALRDAGLREVADHVFDGEDHGSVIPAALMRGLCFAVPAAD
ncbi:alpha/beta hydrolase [Sphingopyxis panaciterrae]